MAITTGDLQMLEAAPDDFIQEVLEREGISREQFDEDVQAARIFAVFGGLAERIGEKTGRRKCE